MCFDLKKMALKIKCIRFFGDNFFVGLFGQVWRNLGKNPSHPQNLPAASPVFKEHERF